MSRTPAAQLARLKVTYQSWHIQRAAGGGFTAQPRGGRGGRSISAPTVAALENALARAEYCTRRVLQLGRSGEAAD